MTLAPQLLESRCAPTVTMRLWPEDTRQGMPDAYYAWQVVLPSENLNDHLWMVLIQTGDGVDRTLEAIVGVTEPAIAARCAEPGT